MPQISNTEENYGKKFIPFLAFVYIIVSFGNVFALVNGIYTGISSITFVAEIAIPFVTMLVFYLYLSTLGKDSNKGALLFILPTAFALIYGYTAGGVQSTLYAFFAVLSPFLAAFSVHFIGKDNGSRASACAVSSFLLMVLKLLENALSVLLICSEKNLRFGTVLFDSISGFISDFTSVYQQTLANAASMYGLSALDPAASAETLNYLESTLITTITLSPAILCAVFFFEMYLFSRIADSISVISGISEKKCFGKYEISKITSIIFNICVTIIMFSILFESKMSAFTFGIFSVLIFVLPNYIILGFRRIFGKLSRVLSKGMSLFLVIIIIFAGLMISPYLLILITVFFGTSEHRASKSDLNYRQ